MVKSCGLPRLRTRFFFLQQRTGETGRGTLVSGADGGRRASKDKLDRVNTVPNNADRDDSEALGGGLGDRH